MPLPEVFVWTRFGTEAGQPIEEIIERKELERRANGGVFLWGLEQAVQKAAQAPGLKGYFRSSAEVLFDIWFGLMPPLMFIATLGLMVVEFTPLMHWLSVPLIPVLEVMQVPEAASAAPAKDRRMVRVLVNRTSTKADSASTAARVMASPGLTAPVTSGR